MKQEYSNFLKTVLEDDGYGLTPMSRISMKVLKRSLAAATKLAQQNPLENSMWENLIDGALKGLEIVAIGSLDWKLTAIVKLLQSWIKDKREEKARIQQETQYGAGSYGQQSFNYDTSFNYGGTYY